MTMSIIIKFGRKQQKHKSFANILKVPAYNKISRIEWLDDTGEQLPSELPKNLKTLICNGKNIKTLPDLPPNMTKLECNNNQLIKLPALPTTLKVLDVGNNGLRRLPNLSRRRQLKELYCGGNKLTYLPNLPDSLVHLACELNNICTLPSKMPSRLMILNVYGNKIKRLPLSILECDMFTTTNLMKDFPYHEVGEFYEDPLSIDENPVYDEIDDANFNLELYFKRLMKADIRENKKRKRDDNDGENKKIKKEQ